jgi:hypothetical protein
MGGFRNLTQIYSDGRSGGLGPSHLRLESQLRDAKNDYSQNGVTGFDYSHRTPAAA